MLLHLSPTDDAARWYERAAFLGERITGLRAVDPDRAAGASPNVDAQAIERDWQRHCADGDSNRFEARLAAIGLTRTEVTRLVRPPQWPTPPAWAVVAAEVAAQASRTADTIDWTLDDRIPFASLIQPWVDWAVERLQGQVDRDLEPLRPSLERAVRLRLRRCGEPAIVALYRRSGVGYRDWILEQRQHRYAELFDALPVWARLTAQTVSRWVDATSAFFGHFDTDEAMVRSTLLDDDPTPIIAIEVTGDPHNGGRQVVIIETAAGKHAVYKPRSLAPEATVTAAGRHLRDHGGLDTDPVPPLLDCGDHGWMAWIEAVPPRESTMADYCRRAGGLLALARALAITDLHDENLLPAGDHPVLVDLECLATSRANDRRPANPAAPPQSLLGRSVLASELLVDGQRFTRDGRDSSGLTGFRVTGEADPIRTYVWCGLGTDAIELHRTTARPQCDEPTVPLDVDSVLEGLTHTEATIARHGLGIDTSVPVPVRVLVQDTSFYANLLDTSLTVRALSDGLRYSIELERVARDATTDDATAWRHEAASIERELLETHDIPLFIADWNDTDGSLATLSIPDLVDEPGTATIATRLLDTTPDRSRLQCDLTRLVLDMRLGVAAATRGGHHVPDALNSSGALLESAAGSDTAIDRCRAIGEHLERQAVRDDFGGLCWLDVDVLGQLPAPLLSDTGLCTGSAGVAVFLAGLANVTGEGRWADLAAATVAGNPTVDENSLYLGTSGRGYALALIGSLVNDGKTTNRGLALLGALPAAANADVKPLDVLFGLPGIAGALGAVTTMTGDDSLGIAAIEYARAAETAWRAAAAGGRRDRIEALRIGVAHGITGVELCAARVYEATGDEQILTWLADMIELENERVDRRGGVPARLDAVSREPDRGWCWGVAGYVMARDTIAAITGIEQAGHATERGRLLAADTHAGNDRLCCGRAAQADVLEPGNPNLTSLLDRPIQWSFEKGTQHQNASLLRGVAGVGLTLLRAAAPGRVPQPLTLDTVRALTT